MKFFKDAFPSPAKSFGFVVIAVLGVIIANAINTRYRVDAKIADTLPKSKMNG